VTEFLSRKRPIAWANQLNAEIDNSLESILRDSAPWQGPYDLGDGLAGLTVYAVERMPRPSARRLLIGLLDRFEETCERRGGGIVWRSRADWVVPRARARLTKVPTGQRASTGRVGRTGYRLTYPDWNLGVANGMAGVIGALGAIHVAGVATERTRRLLEGVVQWLLGQKLGDSTSYFPGLIREGESPSPARTAWCYGDPGVASAILMAARAVGNAVWKREAVRIGLCAARRPASQTGVVDAGLCHGSAGLGHVFHRLYRATNEPRFGRASRLWFTHTLAQRRSGRPLGGFLAWNEGYSRPPLWRSLPGFIRGVSGITLALLAAVDQTEPEWDRVMLLSIKEAKQEVRSDTV